jgi:H+/Cl- antiporter ClcA
MLRVILNILWPSFLVAILAEGCFFSLFDPRELLQIVDLHDLPPLAVYTVGFIFLWLFCSLASSLTYYLTHAPNDRQFRV